MLKDRLKSAREAAGLSQAELGRRVGATQVAICDYERGYRNPSVPILARMATELKVTADYLLGL